MLVLPTEILKDGPILRWATKSNVTDKAAVAKDEMDGEDGGDFEGVWAKRLAALAPKKARDSNMWPVKFCNLLRNLHYLHSPEIGKVIYIIIYIAGVLYATLLLHVWSSVVIFVLCDTEDCAYTVQGPGLDCPRSGPGPVRALFADPGPGPQVQVQSFSDLDPQVEKHDQRL